MGKPANHPIPNLSHLSSRLMVIPSNKTVFEANLAGWMAEVVAHTKNPPPKGVSRPTELVFTAGDSIDVIMHAPTGMALGSGNGKRTVYARFLWGRLPDGSWYVRAVNFSLSMSQQELRLAQQRALKERLLDKAELQYASRFHPREAAFPAEDHINSWVPDVHAGEGLVAHAIETAYQNARKDAAALENPVQVRDMVSDMVGAGVGLAKSTGEGAERLAGVYEATEHGNTAKEAGERIQKGREGEKGWGDVALETGLDIAGLLPGAGPFVKTIAGMIFDIAISSDASRITKIRSRAYVYFVAGYIQALTTIGTGQPASALDKKYFQLGVSTAPGLGSVPGFQIQAALLHFASENYTAGGWGGLAYIGYKRNQWLFPDQYVVNWRPDAARRGFCDAAP